MSVTIAANGQYEQRPVEIGSATATSSDTETVIATIDARGFTNGVISAKNNGAQSVVITVYGSNDSSYGDENSVSSAMYKISGAIASGAATCVYTGVSNSIITVAPLLCAYYRIKLVNNTTGAGHASSTTVYWCLKNT